MRVYLFPILLLYTSFSAAQQPAWDSLPRNDTTLDNVNADIQDNLPAISITDDELFDEGSPSTVSSVLSAGRDPFLSSVSFNFSPVRFRLRGYENGDAIYLNGIDFTGLDNGFTPWGLWSGLTNVMRSRENVHGLGPADFAIGRLGLNTGIDMRAGAQWAQTQIGYAASNRNYRHRIIFTHGSGFNRKGWAYSVMLSPRYADEGYVSGTYYRSLSYYAAVDKKLGNKNILSLIAFGAPTENGRQSPSVQEAKDIAGNHYYNPAWGYQNNKKRNANVAGTFQPAFMLVHELRPTNKSSWMTSIALVNGKRKTSALDWFNAPDPRPDYYRYLPSYYQYTQPALSERMALILRNNPDKLQIDWQNLYEVNRANLVTEYNINGEAGNQITGRRSLYILSNRVIDMQRIMANTNYKSQVSQNISLNVGANYQKQQNEYYQEVKDLLDGDFWLNVNQFAQRAFPIDPNKWQNDINQPNRPVKKNEKYGYDYKMSLSRLAAWVQALVSLQHLDFFAGGEISTTSMYRTGINKNGLFLEQSFGNSEKLDFINAKLKSGLTYKLNGRNYFFLNAAYITAAPYFENIFIAPRTRNSQQPNVKSEIFTSVEGGYRLASPKIKAVLTGYFTSSKNGYDVRTFYYDDGLNQDFVNYALSGIDKIYFGSEMGLEAKLTTTLTLNAAASVGRAYYNSRQQAIITVDNSGDFFTGSIDGKQTVYLKNYRIPSTPQNAYSLGTFYRSPKFWYLSLTANYFDNMWIDPAPSRRTREVFQKLDPTLPKVKEFYQALVKQEKYDARFTLDFFGGWSKKLPKRFYIRRKPVYMVLNLGISNLLNNKHIKSGGFEQARYDANPDVLDANKFASKYYYAYGLNYYGSIMFRF